MDKFFNLKDFDVEPKHPSSESLRRWRSACTIVKNPKRRFRMVADLDMRSEAEKKKRQMQLTEALRLLSLEDVSSSEYPMTEAAEAGRFEDFFAGVRSISDDDAAISLIMQLVHSFSLNGKYRRRIISWQKGDLLGRGSFGDGFFFAVKEVSLQDQGTQGEQSVLQLEQEISLLSRFEHDNIVQYFGTEKDENKLYIFLELVTQGSLAKNYQEYHLKDSQVSAYTWQILNGLKYLHKQNVIHRDIKCANILVEANGSVKLADFGLAKAIAMNDVKSCRGSPFWMAPEVVNLKNDGYGLTADIWSLGCTVLEMLTRRPPYYPLEGIQALFKIGRGELPPIPNSLSRDARDFILKCLQVNPNDRPTTAQLMEHPFVKRPVQTSRGHPSPHYFIMQS
ncbi:hypothetical protein CUMW_186770 [Citrus unshiu]|nr:hypothetical protein CUMW_186770 [Citrus unshiu]